jgi:hypothetical protein
MLQTQALLAAGVAWVEPDRRTRGATNAEADLDALRHHAPGMTHPRPISMGKFGATKHCRQRAALCTPSGCPQRRLLPCLAFRSDHLSYSIRPDCNKLLGRMRA